MWGKSGRVEDYAHIVMTFMPDPTHVEVETFSTLRRNDLSYISISPQFWYLKTKFLLTSNQIKFSLFVKSKFLLSLFGPNLATANITLLPHSLHCKEVALIGTYIVIVGYGSYRSSKGEL